LSSSSKKRKETHEGGFAVRGKKASPGSKQRGAQRTDEREARINNTLKEGRREGIKSFSEKKGRRQRRRTTVVRREKEDLPRERGGTSTFSKRGIIIRVATPRKEKLPFFPKRKKRRGFSKGGTRTDLRSENRRKALNS